MREVLDECHGLPVSAFASGDRLLEQGQAADRMYVLIEGSVAVLKGSVVVAREQEPGALFGEMSALLEAPYSASVTAATPVRAYLVNDPIAFMTERPGLAIHAARLLAQRLHDATSYLADLKVQFNDRSDHLGMVDEILDALMNQQRAVTVPVSEVSDDPRV
jgi:CRP/FNR family cyclic AMP-dependent transcriptional regulator